MTDKTFRDEIVLAYIRAKLPDFQLEYSVAKVKSAHEEIFAAQAYSFADTIIRAKIECLK